MARLIDAELLEESLNKLMMRRGVKSWRDTEFDASDFEELIDDAPTVDAEPVRRGNWLNRQSGMFQLATCSVCGAASRDVGRYCQNCGALMDAEDAPT